MTTGAEKVKKWLKGAFPWALLAVSGWLLAVQMQHCGGLSDGTVAPELVAHTANNDQITLSSYRGNVVVVNFYATWCPPCRREAPDLSRVHARLEESGGAVLGISMDNQAIGPVEQMSRQLGMTYPIAMTDPATIELYGVSQLPTTYVVDPNGLIVDSFVGGVTEDRLQAAVDEARANAPTSG